MNLRTAPLSSLEQTPAPIVLACAFAFTLILGVFDVLSGAQIAMSIFYFVPVGAVAWRCARGWGMSSGLLGGLTWFVADHMTIAEYDHPAIPFWNFAVRTSVFVVFAVIVNELRRHQEQERELARTDGLTSLANTRSFTEFATREIARARRSKRPLSLLYFDCDDFKSINDRWGHSAGDELLRTIAATLTARTRPTDCVARLGGDEFVVLLPETDAVAANIVVDNLRIALANAVRGSHADVTFSIGSVTFELAPLNVDQLIQAGDQMMYKAKRNGKNRVAVDPGAAEPVLQHA